MTARERPETDAEGQGRRSPRLTKLRAAIEGRERLPGCFVRIREALPTLSETERRVCDEILRDPRQIILSSVVELAEKSGVSEATIVRLCRKLGYSGYAEFKVVLSQDLVAPLENIHEDITPLDDLALIVRKVTAANVQALQDTLQVVDPDAVGRAVELLDAAERIACFGMGGSAPLAVDAQHKLLRLGKPCAVHSDKHLQLIAGALMGPGDTVLAISHTGSNRDMLETLEVVRRTGARLVAITHFGQSPITRIADASLFTSARETSYRHESLSSRIATLNIVDILYVALSLRNHKRMVENLGRIREAVLPTRR
jgi:DNA-binding MurR/RpiR family transcriptional regulator